jgi:hypothetical protein
MRVGFLYDAQTSQDRVAPVERANAATDTDTPPLLMLWQLSPGASKQKVYRENLQVSLGTPTLLVTEHPPVMADTPILAGYPLI